MTASPQRTRKILYMPLEFPNWEMGKPMSFSVQFGLEEGLFANGAQTLVVPAFPPPPNSLENWQDRTPELAGGMGLDQAWLGLVHARYDPGFCAWLQENIPVRVGMLFESMTYSPRECEELPLLSGRVAHVLAQVKSLGLTHVLCADELDVQVIQASGLAQALWFPSPMPERWIAKSFRAPLHDQSAFFGNLYSEERQRISSLHSIREILAFPKGPEMGTGFPAAFDDLHREMVRALREDMGPVRKIHAAYVTQLRQLRTQLFGIWFGGLPDWRGIVNLPSYFKGYAGRVIEAMAANVPAVSWEVPDRPRNLALFEDGTEILLFKRNDTDQLMELLKRLHGEPDFGRRIVEACRMKVLAHHTSEIRVHQVFRWIDDGEEPVF